MLNKNQIINTPLYHLSSALENSLNAVDRLIFSNVTNQEPLIQDITNHLLNAGGKRLRPLLCLASSAISGKISPNSIYLATAIELIHVATLLHDDVIDESTLRRGMPTANNKWDNKPSILVGDFLFARSFEIMVKTNNIYFLKLLSITSARISEGEVQQLRMLHSFETSIEEYLNIVEKKTAILFEAACKSGSLAGNPDENIAEKLGMYGKNFGMMYQIMDDIYDYTSQNRGKNIGDDYNEGKITLPVAIAYASDPDKNFWLNAFSTSPSSIIFEEILKRFEKFGAINKSLEIANKYKKLAYQQLEKLDNDFVDLLLKLLEQFN